MKRQRKQKNRLLRRALWLVLLLLLLAGTVFLRYRQAAELAEAAESPAPSAAPATPEPTPLVTAPPGTEATEFEAPTPDPEPPAEETEPPFTAPVGYSEYTYGLVSDLVTTYRAEQADGHGAVQALLTELDAADPALGTLWTSIMNYWEYVNTDLAANYGVLPDGLPEDDSLCIVVLGFQLARDGAMTPELIGRCETALASAEKYPEAYVAVTGGGTAIDNKAATEARAMEAWFLNRGLDPERLIVEDASLTSAENAQFCCRILTEQYPQVKSLAIVTSDYHIALGSLLFAETAFLHTYETGAQAYAVVSNAAYAVPGLENTEGIKKQAQYLWQLADPSY